MTVGVTPKLPVFCGQVGELKSAYKLLVACSLQQHLPRSKCTARPFPLSLLSGEPVISVAAAEPTDKILAFGLGSSRARPGSPGLIPGLKGVANVDFLAGLLPSRRGVIPRAFLAGEVDVVLAPVDVKGKAAFNGVLTTVGPFIGEGEARFGLSGELTYSADDPADLLSRGDLKGFRLVNGLPKPDPKVLNSERTSVGVFGMPG